MFVKHCKVEVYLLELNLCENDNMDNVVTRHFSKADTIGENLYYCSICSALCWTLSGTLDKSKQKIVLKVRKNIISKFWKSPTLSRYYREGDEEALQYPIREGDTALEQVYEQHLWAAEQARQHCSRCWSLSGAGKVENVLLKKPSYDW